MIENYIFELNESISKNSSRGQGLQKDFESCFLLLSKCCKFWYNFILSFRQNIFIEIPKMLLTDKCMKSSSTYEFRIIKCISSDLLTFINFFTKKNVSFKIWPEAMKDFSLWKVIFHLAFYGSGSKGPFWHMIRLLTK